MKVGSTFILVTKLQIDTSLVDSIIFTVKNGDNLFTKENPTYYAEDGVFHIPFTQEETLQMEGRNLLEAQINYLDNSVSKSQIGTFYVNGTLATKVLDGNTATQIGEDIELLIEGDIQVLKGDYNDLLNIPTLDGQELKGDMTADGLNLATKDYVEQEIANFDFIKIVTELPKEGLPNRTYLVAKTSSTDNDLYDEYIWANGSWEFLGTKTIEVDLTDYVKNTDIAGIDNKTGVVSVNNTFGIAIMNNSTYKGVLCSQPASLQAIEGKTQLYQPIVPARLDYAVKKALADSKLVDTDNAWTDEEKASALALLGGVQKPTNPSLGTHAISISTSGEISTIRYASALLGSAIVQRTGSMNIVVPDTPTDDTFATSKKYVDGLIAELQTQIDALKG